MRTKQDISGLIGKQIPAQSPAILFAVIALAWCAAPAAAADLVGQASIADGPARVTETGDAKAMAAASADKLAAISHQASPEAAALLAGDRYGEFVFTTPTDIFESRSRGDLGDDTVVHPAFPVPDPSDRVPCEQIPKSGLAVVLIAGQSNADNATKANDLYKPKSRFYNFNIVDGSCYVARQHALGTTGLGSAFALPLGDELLASGAADNVLVAPIAIGGSYIEEWRPDGGRYFVRFMRALDLLAAHGLAPTALLWQQGELNAAPLTRHITFGLFGDDRGHRRVPDMPALGEALRLNYQMRFIAIVTRLRELGMTAPVFPAISTVCGYDQPSEPIRAAQQALPDPALGIFPGPDSDALGSNLRHDGCHFNSQGIITLAKLHVARMARYRAAMQK